MRYTKRGGNFWLCLLINLLLNLEGTIPAVLLLIAYFVFDISVWWSVGALALWVLGIFLRMKFMGWVISCSNERTYRENKNPYSVKPDGSKNCNLPEKGKE